MAVKDRTSEALEALNDPEISSVTVNIKLRKKKSSVAISPSIKESANPVFIVAVEDVNSARSKPSRSSMFANLAKKASFSKWRNARSMASKSECNMDARPNTFANLKKMFSLLMNMLKRNKQTTDQPDTVTAIENNEEVTTEPMHAEILSATEDEYARILEDLELMAEERIKTLVEVSNRQLCQPETPTKSVHPRSTLCPLSATLN